jgi:hypothetical protein
MTTLIIQRVDDQSKKTKPFATDDVKSSNSSLKGTTVILPSGKAVSYPLEPQYRKTPNRK